MIGNVPKWLTPIVAAIVLAVGAMQVQATTLNPGTTVIPDNIGLAGSPRIVAETNFVPFQTTTASGLVLEFVIAGDTNNKAGGLDFAYLLFNNPNSTDPLTSLSGLNFTGFTTDVSQTPFAGAVGATNVSRTSSGDEVTWNFTQNNLGTLAPGSFSDILIVRTDASNFGAGTISITGGGSANVTGFAPTGVAAVPEPSALALLGGCLIGLSGAGAWRRRKTA